MSRRDSPRRPDPPVEAEEAGYSTDNDHPSIEDGQGAQRLPVHRQNNNDGVLRIVSTTNDDDAKKKQFLLFSGSTGRCTIRTKLLFMFGFLTAGSFALWIFGPYERIIDYCLPSSLIDQHHRGDDGDHHSTTSIAPNSSSGVPTRIPFDFNQCGNETDCCNGLINTCDLRINEIMFATVHNAMATREDGSFLRPHHEHSLESALEAGFRGIHLVVCKCHNTVGAYEFSIPAFQFAV